MNKILLYLILLLPIVIRAQIIDIPDPNFKAVLLSATIENGIARDIDQNYIAVDTNNNSEIEISEAAMVYHLLLGAADISSVAGVENFVNLQTLDCSSNSITSLTVMGMATLSELSCDSNLLTTLNVAGLSGLRYLSCGNNQITALNLTGCTALISIDCSHNMLTGINVSGFINLTSLTCNDNDLTALDVSGLPVLDYLDCSFNELTSLNLEDSPSFTFISCANNQLTTLDASDNDAQMINCSYNQLTTFIIKNGFDDSDDAIQFHENPGLAYLCVDQEELDAYHEIVEFYNYTNCVVGSYCSFTPGGDYNTITGTLLFDANDNGCDPLDVPQSFIRINSNDGTNNSATFTDAAGQYTIYTGAGNFTVAPEFENAYFNVTPLSSSVNFPDTNSLITTENFCITPNGIHNDIEVVMVPIIPANPGFEAVYKIVYRNKGNQVLSGEITCMWDYTKFGNIFITPVPDVQMSGNYTWYYENLLPFENREIVMTLEVNTPTDSFPVNAGDIIDFTAEASISGTDATPQDNNFILSQEVVGSFDPNNIICIEGETASSANIGQYLHYVVNFENTGTAAASFIVVTHEIDPAEFDISTLQILNSSHYVTARITGNTIEFIFNNINLQAAGHGNILFKLKSRTNLQPGDDVMNRANIYFDYNFPVETNEAVTVFEVLNVDDFNQDASIKLYPNPSDDIINISAETNIESVDLYDIQGRHLQTAIINEASARLDISQRAAGIYFAKIRSEKGIKVERIIKQ